MNSVAFSLAAFAPLSQMSFCLTNCVKVGVKVGHFIGFRINGGKQNKEQKPKKLLVTKLKQEISALMKKELHYFDWEQGPWRYCFGQTTQLPGY